MEISPGQFASFHRIANEWPFGQSYEITSWLLGPLSRIKNRSDLDLGLQIAHK